MRYLCVMKAEKATLRITLEASSENDAYRFYRCETYGEAVSLRAALTGMGNECAVGEDSRGWYVRVRKQSN